MKVNRHYDRNKISKMIESEKYILIKILFKIDRNFLFSFTKRNFVGQNNFFHFFTSLNFFFELLFSSWIRNRQPLQVIIHKHSERRRHKSCKRFSRQPSKPTVVINEITTFLALFLALNNLTLNNLTHI